MWVTWAFFVLRFDFSFLQRSAFSVPTFPMTYDYDLAILGDTPAGVAAAVRAVRVRARVVLVTMGWPFWEQRVMLAHRLLLERAADGLGFAEIQRAGEMLQPGEVWGRLARLGVDVVPGWAEFENRRRLTVQPLPMQPDAGLPRTLTARRFLLALPALPHWPDWVVSGVGPIAPAVDLAPAVDTVVSWTTWPGLPQRLLIYGRDPWGIELAQGFCRWGCEVVLLTAAETIAPGVSPELAYLLQAQLEAAGVVVVTGARSPSVAGAGEGLVLRTEQGEFGGDRLIVATGWRTDGAVLQMDRLGLREPSALVPNRKGQTQSPRVYACATHHGPGSAAKTQEAELAVQNALWGAWRSRDDRSVVQAVATEPPLVWVGEQRGIGLQASWRENLAAQVGDRTMGLLQIWVGPQGQVYGAEALGPAATEWMGVIALAIAQRLKVTDLASLPLLSASFAQVLPELAQQWRWQQLEKNPWWEDRLERFFNWRRTGNF